MTSLVVPDAIALTGLAVRYLNVSASELSIERLAGDASTRSYFRVRSRDESVVVALYAEPFDEKERAAARLKRAEAADPAVRLTFANDPCAHVEVTELLVNAGLPVPKVLATSGADAVMLIEDVGDLRLQDWLDGRTDADSLQAYKRAVELIVEIQDATETALEADSICSHLAFDAAKLRWELGFFFANYANRYLHLRLNPSEASLIQADFKALCAELSERPRMLTHRDYHARNLMMHRGEMYIIDHQDARMGPASYDLASLLSDPYTSLTPDMIDELVEDFLEMKSKSIKMLLDQSMFRSELDLMTVQRMLKAIGTYASQAASGNPAYIGYIRPAIERAVAAMERLDRFQATRDFLIGSLSAPATL